MNVGMARAACAATLSVTSLLVLSGAAPAAAAVVVSADGPGNTYELLEAKGFGTELPDCGHNVRHIREVFDGTLNRNTFAMDIHRDLDDDRCNGSTDRQRNEVKTAPGGGDSNTLECANGQTCYYRWKFKLDSGVQPSSSFFHIHQIKANTGGDEGSPVFTITLRKGSPDQIQFIYTAGSGGSGSGTKAQTSLTPFKGVWVEAFVAHKASDSGFINASIKRLSDGATLISWNSGTIDTWRSGNSYNRGKWGLYRSLNDKASLRDETMLINDWCVTEASNGSDCPSAIGSSTPTPTATPRATPRATPTSTATPTATPTGATPTPTATPVSGGVSFEAENVAFTNSGTGATVQTDPNASGGKWVSLDAENTGSWIEFTTPSIPAGTYSLRMSYKTNDNRGQLSMKVDGTQVGGTLDQYHALPSTYPTATFGTVTFGSSGTHKLRLTVTGKNSASSSFVLSADKFTLQ